MGSYVRRAAAGASLAAGIGELRREKQDADGRTRTKGMHRCVIPRAELLEGSIKRHALLRLTLHLRRPEGVQWALTLAAGAAQHPVGTHACTHACKLHSSDRRLVFAGVVHDRHHASEIVVYAHTLHHLLHKVPLDPWVRVVLIAKYQEPALPSLLCPFNIILDQLCVFRDVLAGLEGLLVRGDDVFEEWPDADNHHLFHDSGHCICNANWAVVFQIVSRALLLV